MVHQDIITNVGGCISGTLVCHYSMFPKQCRSVYVRHIELLVLCNPSSHQCRLVYISHVEQSLLNVPSPISVCVYHKLHQLYWAIIIDCSITNVGLCIPVMSNNHYWVIHHQCQVVYSSHVEQSLLSNPSQMSASVYQSCWAIIIDCSITNVGWCISVIYKTNKQKKSLNARSHFRNPNHFQ